MCVDQDPWVRQSALGIGMALWAGTPCPGNGAKPRCEGNLAGATAAVALAISTLLLLNASAFATELPARGAEAIRGLGQLVGYHDFGVARIAESFTHEFIGLNDSADPLLIEEVLTSCDCLRVEAFPRVIEPGHHDTLSLNIHPDSVGTMDWFVYALFTEHSC